MPFDFETLTAQERARYHAIGKQYATADVLAQASKSLRGYELYGHLLAALGFGADDGAELYELRDVLRAFDSSHIQAVDDRRFLGQTYQTAKRDALDERITGRTLVSTSLAPLSKVPQPELAQRGALLLQTTKNVDGDKQLVDQLKSLHDFLSQAALEAIIATRGGPDIVTRLQDARVNLIANIQERTSTPEISAASERRDILDGAVVHLCRAARDASRVAARRHGQPAIAAAFKLDLLRPSRSSAPATPGAEDPVSALPSPSPVAK